MVMVITYITQVVDYCATMHRAAVQSHICHRLEHHAMLPIGCRRRIEGHLHMIACILHQGAGVGQVHDAPSLQNGLVISRLQCSACRQDIGGVAPMSARRWDAWPSGLAVHLLPRGHAGTPDLPSVRCAADSPRQRGCWVGEQLIRHYEASASAASGV